MRAWRCRDAPTAALSRNRRCASTSEGYTYRPGRVARALRCALQAVMPAQQRRRLAACMQQRLMQVESLEKEQLWLRRHGSPLRAMGLPDHAALSEVRARYHSLLVETHPDTAAATQPTTTTTTAAAAAAGTAASVAASDNDKSSSSSSTNATALSVGESRYALLRSAYDMATNPDSLWHQNGSAPDLYRELVHGSAAIGSRAMRQRRGSGDGGGGSSILRSSSGCSSSSMQTRSRRRRRCVEAATLFALASYALMLVAVALFVVYALPRLLEAALEAFDRDFYAFMIAQEERERQLRARGEVVDTDPKRLAPTVIQKLLRPGRFIHGESATSVL